MIRAPSNQHFGMLTGCGIDASVCFRNTPVSFGEGARSRSERVGSCFFRGASA